MVSPLHYALCSLEVLCWICFQTCHSFSVAKVRAALGSASLDAKPFSPKEQWLTADPEESELEEAVGEATTDKRERLSMKPKQPKTKTKPKPAKDKHQSDYNAGEFNKVFKEFMLQAKEKGLKRPEALEQWKQFPERARLLEGMPLSEQKRRRFIPCGKAA